MSVHVGIRSGARVGIGVGVNSRLGTADRDATSNKYVPSTAAQWSSLGLTPPTDLWMCDEEEGDLVDEINGTILTANGSPLYQRTVSGWTRKAVAMSGGVNQRFQHATYNNVASSSLLVLMYMLVGDTPAAVQGVLTAGTSFSAAGVGITTTPRIRYRNGASITDTTSPYNTAAIPLVFQHDRTNSAARLCTATEKLTPTFGAAAGTIFGIGTGTAANFFTLYLAAWRGSAAEMSAASIKSMLQALGWTVTWNP